MRQNENNGDKAGLTENLPISVKLLIPLILMMGLTGAMALYGLQQTSIIKSEYQKVVNLSEQGKAIYIATGAIRSLGLLTHQMAAEEDAENLQYVKEDMDRLEQAFTESAAALLTALPGADTDVKNAVMQFSQVLKIAEEARQAALQGDKESIAYILANRFDLDTPIGRFEGLIRAVADTVTAADQAALLRYAETRRITLLVGAVGMSVVMVLALILTIRHVSRPLSRIIDEMTRLSGGELNISIHGGARRDEIGATARAVAVFQRVMLEAETLRIQQDVLRSRAEAEKRAALTRVADDFRGRMAGIVRTVAQSAEEMRDTAVQLAAVARQTDAQSCEAGSSTGAAVDSVDSVAAATDQLSASIQEISEKVVESEEIARRAVAGARQSETAMDSLRRAAEEIGDIVKLIQAIASRTNLLALNATIEAARAGDAGRGFAIVAQEVKALANQTAQATSDVGRHIADIRNAAGGAAQAIHGVGEIVERMAEIALTVSAAVSRQGQATREIAVNAGRAADNTGNARSVMSGVICGAKETGSIADLVLSSAKGLVGECDHLRDAVNDFVRRVQSG